VSQAFDILGIGSVSVDDVLFVECYPSADAKEPVLHRQRRCGGLVATALVAAARLGAKCAFAGLSGDDELSRFALQQLANENVGTLPAPATEQSRPVHSTIVVDKRTGTRTIFYEFGNMANASVAWVSDATIASARALIVDDCMIGSSEHAVKIARKHSIPVIADFESRDMSGCETLLASVDHLIVSQNFAERATGCKLPADCVSALWNKGRALVAVTAGAAGCWYLSAQDPVVHHQPAFAVNVVDTTGCGDVFHGAYAVALVDGANAQYAIRFAAAAAAIKASRHGGQTGCPTQAELVQFLESPACRIQN
jgi:sulfofructose kinase